MSKLTDMKVALKQLKELGLPVSREQEQALIEAENEYLENEVIPKIKELLKDAFSDIEHKAKIIIEFDGDSSHEPNVYKEDVSIITPVRYSSDVPYKYVDKGRNTGLRVTFPNGEILQDRGVNVLENIVKRVGPELIHEMNIICCGLPLVDDHHDNGLYGKRQQLLPGGYWLITNSSTITKKRQIDAISDALDLNLKVEVLDDKGEVLDINSPKYSTRTSRQIIEVTTPDGKYFSNNIQWKTLRDVVIYAGIDNVMQLGIKYVGIPLIDVHTTPGMYEAQQHEIAPNRYLNTATDTMTKMKQIQEISDRLNLGLSIKLS